MKPIRAALLSFGMSGKVFHAPFLHLLPAFQLAGAWERSRKEIATRYPGATSFDTLDQLLADDSIELVVVNTPNYTHYEYTKRALEAGKHVVVEKPFVTTVAEGEELCRIAGERGLLLSVYHNRRWDSDLLSVKEVIGSGALGEIVEAALHFDRFKAELSPKLHKEKPGPGAGVLYDLGSHLIDSALHLFGTPYSVFADIRCLRPGSEVDDYFELLLYYPRLRVRLHASYFVREAPPSFQLYGTAGSFLKPRGDVQEARLQAGEIPGEGWGAEDPATAGLLHSEHDDSAGRRTVAAPPGDYRAYFNGVAAAIRNGAPAPVTCSEGLQVIRVIETAFRSAAEGRVLPF
ncbi:oxidoreductase [Flaviaesturariibacter flavus]|uniref:Oxidoreductase n=1 Tax=Flaviaesturariibacter flavus TaxID=2502780 RepID=A0A4R1BB54_9BACT|nr:Gfo/Idh/MocA family oxidoreductase [Flaviaesturariibacter flavus]TCJ14226.1 oxidoreductase [Flaviaesturariibacter flavus]